jgi:MoxR-like ATPase
MSDAMNIITAATDLQANHNKTELVMMARGLGWKGDHARAPVLQLALFVATKLQAGDRGEQHAGSRAESGHDVKPEHDAPAPAGNGGRPPEGQQESQQGDQQDSQQGDHQGDQQDSQQGDQQGDQQQPEQGDQQGQQQPEQGQQGDQQQQQQQPEQPEQPDANEFDRLLASSGIATPHPMLEKVWLLAAKARQNVMLVGAAGTGKTMLAEQVAQMLRVPFGSVSCTMGMSESQLTGWLLPVGDAGRFDYVPAPFVTCLQQPSVFLLDEIDAADPNVLMLCNSVLSNGFVTIPHKLNSPTVTRHAEAVVIAGANTTGSGADDLYTARSALDGSTVDRFYPIVTDYDEAYEHGLFNLGRKSRRKSAAWARGPLPDQFMMDDLRKWFFNLRKQTKSAKLNKIVSSRFAQRLAAAVAVGIPAEEAKRDLLLGWSVDELARVGIR